MTVVTMRELLEAGVHFGHQSTRWNPKMKRYIYSSRNNIHVIDLHKTIPLIETAYEFVRKTIKKNGTILFVGTKKQAQEAIEQEAKRCGMYFVNQRWLGGMLTNFKTLKKNIGRMKDIEKMEADGTMEKLPKKEVATIKREYQKLIKGLDGIRDMTGLPDVMFIVDVKKEAIAAAEAKRLEIPIVAMVDTNCDPDEVDYPIPSNDDAIRSIKLLTALIANAVLDARSEGKALEEGEAAIGVPEEVPEEIELAVQLSEEERLEALEAARLKKLTEAKEAEERVGF